MEKLKKRSVATFIAVAVIILSTLFSANRSLGAECQEITDSFTDGVIGVGGYVVPSISTQLRARCDAANALAALVADYEGVEEQIRDLRAARNELIDEPGIDGKYDKNSALQVAFDDLVQTVEAIGVSEDDAKAFETYKSNFSNAQGLIEKSGYNESVRAYYRETLNVFPTNLLKDIVGVDLPELFE